MSLSWLLLIIAGLLEIGWPLGFKLSQTTQYKIPFIIFAIVCMALSGLFLWMAQREISIGTAYAVWTGIGASGTFLVGIIYFNDPAGMLRLLSFLLVIVGIAGLKISS
jgi:quaternary ammonium compound-resistance protein SugE